MTPAGSRSTPWRLAASGMRSVRAGGSPLVLALACAACGPVAIRPAAAPDLVADGAILERAPCPTIAPEAFPQALDAYYRADLLKAGLAGELAAKPLIGIFTAGENQGLAAAAAAGRCERVLYRSSGLRVAGFVLRPAQPGPHPVLIWLRGGNRDYGKIEPVTLLNLLWLADAGFVVVATQYRGADGGEGVDEFGGADVDDVLALVPLARALPDADVARLYLLGGSRGGMQGTIAMRRGLPVRAAAFRGGVFDLKETLAYRPEMAANLAGMIPGGPAGFEAALAQRSAIGWAGELRVPILLLHGRQDWRQRVSGTQAFAAALASAQVGHKLVIYERDEHQLALHRPDWLAEAVAWFRANGAFEVAADPAR